MEHDPVVLFHTSGRACGGVETLVVRAKVARGAELGHHAAVENNGVGAAAVAEAVIYEVEEVRVVLAGRRVEDEYVLAEITNQGVVAQAADQRVVAFAALNAVGAVAGVEVVIACAAVDDAVLIRPLLSSPELPVMVSCAMVRSVPEETKL
jgi:hypothetical protein